MAKTKVKTAARLRRDSPEHEQLRRSVRSVIVNVPDVDWASVITGEKRVFRSYNRRVGKEPWLMPTPCVAWRRRGALGVDKHPLFLEDTYVEMLGAITPDDLAAEGFPDDLPGFKRYFGVRYPNGGYRPLSMVQVYRVRPLELADLTVFAERVIERLGYSL